MITFLQSRLAALIIGVLLYGGVSLFVWKSARVNLTPPRPVSREEEKNEAGPSWTFHNPEVDQLIGELRKEKELLAQREQQLTDLAARLQAERAEMNQVTHTVGQLQADLDQKIVRVNEEEILNLKKLAKVYSTMSADSAAIVMKELDDTAVVKILIYMKESETAPILEVMAKQGDVQAKRVAALSERLRLSISRTPANASKKP